MLEYISGESRYETASRSGLENTAGAHSLRRYKLTSVYRLQLRRAILDADAAESRAHTDLEKRKLRLRRFEARTELAHLESGGMPSATYGLIALRVRD